MRRLLWALPCLLALTACPKRFLGFGSYGRMTDPLLIIDAIKTRRNAVQSVQGDAKAYLSSPKGNGKLAQYLVAQKPDHVRIESLSFFGDPVAVLTSDGSHFALHQIKENKFYDGAATPENVSRLLPLEVSGDELVSLIMGVPPLIADAHIAGFELDQKESVYRITLASDEATELLSVETSSLHPLGVSMSARPGLTPYRATFDDYDEKLNLPKDIQLFAPDGKTKIELKWKSREMNGEIDEDVFVQPPPDGVPRTQL